MRRRASSLATRRRDGAICRGDDSPLANAVLLMLKAAGGQATVGGYDDALWPGSSSGHFCRVYGLTAQ